MKKKCLLTGMAIIALLFCLMLLGCWLPEDDGFSAEGSGTEGSGTEGSGTEGSGGESPGKEQAITLTADEWTKGNLAANGVQWYKFLPTSPFSHYIHILFETLTNVNVTLYTNSGYAVSQNNLYGNTFESRYTGYGAVFIIGNTSKWFYIKVEPGSFHNGTYRITFNGSPAPTSYVPLFDLEWTAVADSTFDSYNTIQAITYGGGKFVAVGSSVNLKIAYSTLKETIQWKVNSSEWKIQNLYHIREKLTLKTKQAEASAWKNKVLLRNSRKYLI